MWNGITGKNEVLSIFAAGSSVLLKKAETDLAREKVASAGSTYHKW